MASRGSDSLCYVTDLANALSREDINKLLGVLDIPEGICISGCGGVKFIFALIECPNIDLNNVSDALVSIGRRDLLILVEKLDCLFPKPRPQTQSQMGKNLIEMLKAELSENHLTLIYMCYPIISEVKFESIMSLMFEKTHIKKDLSELTSILIHIKLNCVAASLGPYIEEFKNISEYEFVERMRRDIKRVGKKKQIQNWESSIKEYLVKFRKVKQMTGNNKPVNFEELYVDLTILKQKPRYVSDDDKTTYSDIAYIMEIADKHVQVPINFTEELRSCNSYKPGIWCIIGNIGSGKTFLCNKIVLEYAFSNTLPEFSSAIYIHCQDQRWNEMESSRIDKGLQIDPAFIHQWLYLGLPAHTPDWCTALAEHITEMDGEGLLLIIDGLDQFTNDVPLKKTLLYLLLTRQALSSSHIILTSRPGAWTDISTLYQLHITSFYHVLGFSPAQRDEYLKKQFNCASVQVQERCTQSLDRYDEMKQLSLIPINAAFFSFLINSDHCASVHSLTQCYYHLTLYLMWRQLSKQGEIFELRKISKRDSGILHYLYSIGLEAYQDNGQERGFDDKFGNVQRSGLVHEYAREGISGVPTKVWLFPHLTLQVFTGAIWGNNTTSWKEQFLSVKEIVDTNDEFYLSRMLIRSLCELSTESLCVPGHSYKHLIPNPIPTNQFPECMQLRLETSDFLKYTEWEEFSVWLIQLCKILFESKFRGSFLNSFNVCTRFLPKWICLYIINKVKPNEWNCLLKMFPLLEHFYLIYVAGDYVSPDQLLNLFNVIKECDVRFFVLELFKKNNEEVLAYINTVRTELPKHTQFTLKLDSCELNEESLYSCSSDHTISNLSLVRNEFRPSSLGSLLKAQISTCQNLNYVFTNKFDFQMLISGLSSAKCIHGLHLHHIPIHHHEQLFSLLLRLTNIRELTWVAPNPYSILPFITHLTTLDYLKLGGPQCVIDDAYLSNNLQHLLNANRASIRVLQLMSLGSNTEYMCLDGFIKCLPLCSKLIQLNLEKTRIRCDDVNIWYFVVSRLVSLLQLKFNHVFLGKGGHLHICRGLFYHSSIMNLELSFCDLDSESCLALNNLIPTLKQLKSFSANEISKPNPQNIALVKLTADRLAIEHKLQ